MDVMLDDMHHALLYTYFLYYLEIESSGSSTPK
jgi:hypothetical protein